MSKETWLQAFKSAHHRDPSPEEFLAAKAANFEVVTSNSEVEGQVPQMTTVKPHQVWSQTFETQVGRKPSADEFLYAKENKFDLTTIAQFVPVKREPIRLNRKQKRLIAAVTVSVLALGGGYWWGNSYYSQAAVADRYLKAVESDFDSSLAYQVWSDTHETISEKELTYLDRASAETFSRELLENGQMVNVGRKFLFFPDWRVAVLPTELQLESNVKDLAIRINDKDFETTDSEDYYVTLERLYPGHYVVEATGKVNGQSINLSDEVNSNLDGFVSLNVERRTFTVKSNLTTGDLYVGEQKIGTLKDGQYHVEDLPIVGDAEIYVQKSYEDKSVLTSKVYEAESLYDEQTITLDAQGVLDKDTAESLMSAAYSKLATYAYDNETPDNLEDVFENGNQNKFFTDVKNTIDTNTINAKNREADSISFSSMDVTSVTQTGKATYKVDFTVMYDFYYGYDSENKTSGHIKQKMQWAANVKFVGDTDNGDSYGFNSYTDYVITGPSGASKVLTTENTVK